MNNLIFLCTQCAYAATTTFHPYLCALYDYVVTILFTYVPYMTMWLQYFSPMCPI